LFYNTPGAGGQKANRDLTAERIRSRELILEQQLPDNSRLVVFAFLIKISDLISMTRDPADGLLVYRNSAGATGKGLEVQYEKTGCKAQKYVPARVDKKRAMTRLGNARPIRHSHYRNSI